MAWRADSEGCSDMAGAFFEILGSRRPVSVAGQDTRLSSPLRIPAASRLDLMIRRSSMLSAPVRLTALLLVLVIAATGCHRGAKKGDRPDEGTPRWQPVRSEEHTSELQSQSNLVCRLLLEKKKKKRRHRYKSSTLSRAN